MGLIITLLIITGVIINRRKSYPHTTPFKRIASLKRRVNILKNVSSPKDTLNFTKKEPHIWAYSILRTND